MVDIHHSHSQARRKLEVFYDGECPICIHEIDLYARMDRENAIIWTPIETLSDTDLPADKTREVLLGRFHVRDFKHADTWHKGVDAFARIWAELPGLRHIAFIFKVPIVRQLAQGAYKLFLRWQRWHRTHRRNHPTE